MNKTNPTEGKLFVSDEGNGDIYIKVQQGAAICKMYTENGSVQGEEQAIANATLLASSKEMLNALQLLVNFKEKSFFTNPEPFNLASYEQAYEARKAALLAIQSATGQPTMIDFSQILRKDPLSIRNRTIQEEFGLKDEIKANGMRQPLKVAFAKPNIHTGEQQFILVDGFKRCAIYEELFATGEINIAKVACYILPEYEYEQPTQMLAFTS